MLRLRKRIVTSCTFARSPTSSFDDLGDVTDNGAIAIQVCFEPTLYFLLFPSLPNFQFPSIYLALLPDYSMQRP